MRHQAILSSLLPALALAGCGAASKADKADVALPAMTLSSPAFAAGQPLPAQFTCDGANRSPPLQWSKPPPATRSFALVIEDPDAPGGTFRHWGAFDIPKGTRAVAIGAPGLAQAGNDFGQPGYGGPCPPPGKLHHYHFRVLALDVATLSPARPGIKGLLDAARPHVLATGELVATYKR